MRRRVARLPVTLLAFFFRQLATLIGSGIPLVQAWQLLMADMPGRYRRPLHLAALQMEQGVCPSQAMDQCRAFPELACRLIRAGEQTGNLEGLCRVLADFYETKGKERRLLVQALAYPAFLNYGTTKGAVISMTQSIAMDYVDKGIRCNAICPGTVESPFVEAYLQKYHQGEIEETRKQLHARQPIGRMGRPSEIAPLALYLASDESAFVTGAQFAIDGGWTAR